MGCKRIRYFSEDWFGHLRYRNHQDISTVLCSDDATLLRHKRRRDTSYRDCIQLSTQLCSGECFFFLLRVYPAQQTGSGLYSYNYIISIYMVCEHEYMNMDGVCLSPASFKYFIFRGV